MNTSSNGPTNANRSNTVKTVVASYWGIWVVLAVLFVVFTLRISGFKPHTDRKTEVAKAMRTPAFAESDYAGLNAYVGSKRCKDCHWGKYDSWKNTLHSKFMQPVNDYTVIADFERKNTLTNKVTDTSPKLAGEAVTSTMFKKDGRLYANTIGPDWELHDYEIINVIGIGRRQNYLSKFPNGEIHVLPVEWDAKTKTWMDLNGLQQNVPGDGEYWSDSESTWQFKCGGCHVTGIEINYNEADKKFGSTWIDLGIACEACHGPGGNHVEAASKYFDYEKETIVNPAKLPWQLRAMVCGRCHKWGASIAQIPKYMEGYPKTYSYPHDYLPGKALYLSYEEEPEDKKKHHQQYNEWSTSEHAKKGIMCTNCHKVHQEEDIKVSITKEAPDNLCMSCHITLQRRAAHRIHTFGSCVSCHMPETIGHEHSHTFQFISPELSVRAGGIEKQPNSCNGCHHHKDTPPEDLIGFLEAVTKEDMPKPFTVHKGLR